MACNWIVTPCDCPVPCYTLQDCLGVLDDIQIVPPATPSPIGTVYTFSQYPDVCWEIVAQGTCIDPLAIEPTATYDDCVCCLPTPEPEPEVQVHYPFVITKIFNRITVGECDIQANERFAEATYDQVKRRRFGIETSCPIDLDKAWLKKRLSDLASIYNPELCTITVPNPCCEEEEPECEYPTIVTCARATDITTEANFDCDAADLTSVTESFS